MHFFKSYFRFFVFFISATCLPLYGQVSTEAYRVEWKGITVQERDKAPSLKFITCEPCVTVTSYGQPAASVLIDVQNGMELANYSVRMLASEPLTSAENQIVESWGKDNVASDEMGIYPERGNAKLKGNLALIRKDEQSGKFVKATSLEVSYTLSARRTAVRKTFSPNSVLANGTWYKVSVERDGVFKITPKLLQDMGASSSINSNSLQVYGNRGGMLPERVGDPHVDDLFELPILVNDGGDGVFNGNDYALFYAKGPHQWEYSASDSRFNHMYNVYSDVNYYFIRVDGNAGKRISQGNVSNAPANQNTTTFDDFDFLEETKVNIVRGGRQWFGDEFDFNLSYNYAFSFPNLAPGTQANIKMRAIVRSNVPGTFMTANASGSQVLSLNFGPPAWVTDVVAAAVGTANFNASGNSINLNVTFNNQINPSATAWLDYISLNVRRQLTFSSNALVFRDMNTVGTGNVTQFTISNVPGSARLWDVTDALQTFSLPLQLSGNSASFRVETDTLRTFVVVNGSNFPEPRARGSVANQNLHGLQAQDMLIITYPGFRPAAERLAQFRAQHNGFKVKVINVTDIYNEFHSGVQDVSAIRNFIRSNYVKAPNGTGLKYVCLMGTASYDYKNVQSNNTNFVPVFQSIASFDINSTSIVDDYYTFLDEGEGTAFTINSMDVSIGRLTVRSLSQANAVVDKIINYETGKDRFGDWRSRMLFVTDDVDAGWERQFMTYSEQIIDSLSNRYAFYNFLKIYADAFQQVSTAGSQRYPDVQDEIFRQVQNGALITNYIGHGGETGWAQEQILRLEEINNWTNKDRLSIFVTITCDFSRFDEVWRTSAGEQTLINPEGGAIALLSTTRVVQAIPAMDLNRLLFDIYRDEISSASLSIGDWIRITKNATTSNVKINFALLGDPAITIPFPKYNVITEEMYDVLADEPTDTIRALSKTKVTGRVANPNGTGVSAFDGILDVAVFDKPMQRQTLNNDGMLTQPFTFSTQNNTIYRGRVSIVNGRFSFEFITPVNIAYQFAPGKFSYYGSANAGEAAGGDRSPIIGGLDTNAAADDQGPEIELYMNDESFVYGGMTDENPDLYAILFDSSGINTVGNSIGHDIVATLNHQSENPIVLNDYYTAELNSYQRGTIRYPFFELEEGPHTLSLRAWDVHNNPANAQTEFVVASSAGLALKHVLNYPNPFTTRTLFQFEHNRPNQPLEVLVQIFTVSGRLVKTLQANVFSQGHRVVDDIPWDGLDDFGDRIGKGVYIYRLKVRSSLDDAYAEKMEKLVILR